MGVSDLVWIHKFDNHHLVKGELMRRFEKTPFESTTNDIDGTNISKTDYFLEEEDHFYYDFLRPYLNPFFSEVCNHYFVSEIERNGIWYQTYKKGGYHGWHLHPECNISCVYCVDLPDPTYSTEFFDTNSRTKFSKNAVEGDIIVFPSFIPIDPL